jgi:hypothetical protein
MKTMKVALLATAALAAVTVSARADDASALKAELAALNARVAQLEASPAVPVGYSLLTIADGQTSATPGLEVLKKDAFALGDKSTVVGIMPTADMPASTTIEWSGYVRAAIVYTKTQGYEKDTSIRTRGQLNVKAKTDTAVGEVGVKIGLRANGTLLDNNPNVVSNEYWGYWAMTPELTLGGGYTGSLGNIGYGYDGACTCQYTDNFFDSAFNPGDSKQMRLSYASGPLSMAIAIEDATRDFSFDPVGNPLAVPPVLPDVVASGGNPFGGGNSDLGVAAEIKYSGDAINGEISAVWRNSSLPFESDPWQVGAGVGFSLGDMASISLAAAAGKIYSGQKFWGASALASANLSETIHLELGGAYRNWGNSNNNVNFPGPFADSVSALAGLYYDPVSQLTIGLEAEYFNPKGGNNNTASVDLVTVFRF